MGDTVGFVLVIILIALVFDFINGFHDSANSIATVVSTRVLSPGVAVAWAAFFNFIAAFTVGTAVAKTISKGLIDPSVVDPTVVLAALRSWQEQAQTYDIADFYEAYFEEHEPLDNAEIDALCARIAETSAKTRE